MTRADVSTRPMALRPAALALGGWMQREQAVMGTAVTVQVWADDRTRGAAAMAAVMAEMQRIDRCYSPHRADSELSIVNAAAAQAPVRISDELFQLVARAQEFSRLTGGAFDITYASAGVLYDYREGVLPDDISLARAVQAIGWRHLQLDPVTPALRFTRPGVRIDLGGFAKGHAVDRCCALLQRHGIRHAIVSAGGDSRVLGDRRGRPWTIAIRHPRQAGQVVATLPVHRGGLATSGDYERAFDLDGRRWCHVLDPSSGMPVTHWQSVSVLAANATAAGSAATLTMLMQAQGLHFLHSSGLDFLAIDHQGELHMPAEPLQSAQHAVNDRQTVG